MAEAPKVSASRAANEASGAPVHWRTPMKKSAGILAACFLVAVSVTFLFAHANAPRTAWTNPQITYEDHHDVSLPLEELIARTPQFTDARHEAPLYNTGRPRIVARG